MIKIHELMRKLRGGKPAPIIPTPYGEPVTEKARLQAAFNMKMDPVIKLKVEQVLIKQYGEQLGLLKAKERYPEAYE